MLTARHNISNRLVRPSRLGRFSPDYGVSAGPVGFPFVDRTVGESAAEPLLDRPPVSLITLSVFRDLLSPGRYSALAVLPVVFPPAPPLNPV